ncbi:MAG: hypothetical protein Kow0013_25260 [Pararhodobacter sp.]
MTNPATPHPAPDTDRFSAGFWNRVARKYAAAPVANLAAYEATLDRARAWLKPTDSVLEFGAGTSSTALHLAPHVARYLATDISAEMVAIGREKLADTPVASLRIEQGALDDHARGGPYDAVLGFSILHLVPDLDATLRLAHDALRPGGVFISKTPCLGGVWRVMMPVLWVLRALGKAPGVLWFTPAALERAIARAGFEILETGTDPGRMPRRTVIARRT